MKIKSRTHYTKPTSTNWLYELWSKELKCTKVYKSIWNKIQKIRCFLSVLQMQQYGNFFEKQNNNTKKNRVTIY